MVDNVKIWLSVAFKNDVCENLNLIIVLFLMKFPWEIWMNLSTHCAWILDLKIKGCQALKIDIYITIPKSYLL